MDKSGCFTLKSSSAKLWNKHFVTSRSSDSDYCKVLAPVLNKKQGISQIIINTPWCICD